MKRAHYFMIKQHIKKALQNEEKSCVLCFSTKMKTTKRQFHLPGGRTKSVQ